LLLTSIDSLIDSIVDELVTFSTTNWVGGSLLCNSLQLALFEVRSSFSAAFAIFDTFSLTKKLLSTKHSIKCSTELGRRSLIHFPNALKARPEPTSNSVAGGTRRRSKTENRGNRRDIG